MTASTLMSAGVESTGERGNRIARGRLAGMPSLFSRIVSGELPSHQVWSDEDVVAFLSIAPLTPGHTLVVPRVEVDQWTDAPEALRDSVFRVAGVIGAAVKQAFGAPRAGLVIAGFEVFHLHAHVFPAWSMTQFDFTQAAAAAPEELAGAAEKIRAALRAAGRAEVSS